MYNLILFVNIDLRSDHE